ncbi:response regulator [Qipengyuania aquimaris]|uniref:response regulator n=1 Tax=Qipengyuania aquimaris TaxID=255984 RepID=UPI001C95F60A|nr:response regulator [Qipengyuania aquimaris]MBY6127826.1 response regulator [Qipengyuania aquimaris]
MKSSSKKTAAPKLPNYVLVVEDDAILSLNLQGALEDAGVKEVVLCTTTDQALEALRRKKPDAIVLDVHLADRDDGWAVAELVETLGPKPPRVIFSTGAPQDIPEDVATLGCVLEKPYDSADLVSLLGQPERTGIIKRLRGALGAK